jgi:hypothetical protein
MRTKGNWNCIADGSDYFEICDKCPMMIEYGICKRVIEIVKANGGLSSPPSRGFTNHGVHTRGTKVPRYPEILQTNRTHRVKEMNK